MIQDLPKVLMDDKISKFIILIHSKLYEVPL